MVALGTQGNAAGPKIGVLKPGHPLDVKLIGIDVAHGELPSQVVFHRDGDGP